MRKKAQRLGTVRADDEAEAIDTAIAELGIALARSLPPQREALDLITN